MTLATDSVAETRRARGPEGRGPNILMIMTDQEVSRGTLPTGMIEKLPGHLELLAMGVSIDGYHVQTTPCSPSRSTMMTGRHTQATGVYLNNDTPPNPPMKALPTLGHMLRAADYYTVYKGKWHLSGINAERNWPGVPGRPTPIYPNTQDAMERFGFSDYGFNGEEVGLTWAGYHSDRVVAGDAARLILDFKDTGRSDGKPWFMVVGLVNPHDIMFFDATGKQAKTRLAPDLLGPLRQEPGDPLYAEDLGFDLPDSFYKDDLSTKPEAHRAIRRFNDMFYGELPLDDHASWRRFNNYYYNCIRDVDRNLQQLLWALREAGELDNTVIVYTSDHGERAGAHGLRQKAGTMYREETAVPMIIAHPDVEGGQGSSRLMSAVDIAPTLLGFAGKDEAWRSTHFPDLCGVDVSELAADPNARTARDARGHLFNYAVAYMWERLPHGEKPANGTLPFDLSKRRLHRGVHDGRYKFARYFAPAEHHRPEDWEMLARHNDLELYDTERDPGEIVNLAGDPGQQANILRLNAMVNHLVDLEVGADDGREYPGDSAAYRLS